MTGANGILPEFELEDLDNLDPVSSRQLRTVGIESGEQLRQTGPVQTFMLVPNMFPSETSVTFLYAVQEALLDVPLNQITEEEKERLRDEVRGAAPQALAPESGG
jgi:hypothetical protein|tara:strand:+ start:413 stop:727 length:315 start_codon:yes stop_codon:yes gene_type:complete